MRSAFYIFGIAVSALVVAIVARYGFVTADTDFDAYLSAFWYGGITTFALLGHAGAVHLWRRRQRWGAAFVAFVALICLPVSISNSVGFIASRGDTKTAEREKAAKANREDHAELGRVGQARAALPAFQPSTDEAVEAARQAVSSAETSAKDECKRRGTECRKREDDEKARRTELAAAISNRALTLKAADIEAKADVIRARLAASKPVKDANPQAAELGRILRLPQELVASGQHAYMAIAMELAAIASLIAAELLGTVPTTPPPAITATSLAAQRREEQQTTMPEPAAAEEPELALPRIADVVKLSPRPVEAPPEPPGPEADEVPVIIGQLMSRAEGAELPLSELHEAYVNRCRKVGENPADNTSFIARTGDFCRGAGIRSRRQGEEIIMIGVALNEPASNVRRLPRRKRARA